MNIIYRRLIYVLLRQNTKFWFSWCTISCVMIVLKFQVRWLWDNNLDNFHAFLIILVIKQASFLRLLLCFPTAKVHFCYFIPVFHFILIGVICLTLVFAVDGEKIPCKIGIGERGTWYRLPRPDIILSQFNVNSSLREGIESEATVDIPVHVRVIPFHANPET